MKQELNSLVRPFALFALLAILTHPLLEAQTFRFTTLLPRRRKPRTLSAETGAPPKLAGKSMPPIAVRATERKGREPATSPP